MLLLSIYEEERPVFCICINILKDALYQIWQHLVVRRKIARFATGHQQALLLMSLSYFTKIYGWRDMKT